MNEIRNYSRLLRIRSIFKRVQQLSWNLNKVESKYNPDSLDANGQTALLETYLAYIDELRLIYDELKNERDKKPKS